jgi:predicted MFS family arabinose efflux permease
LGFGSIVMPLVVHRMIAGYGWRTAFVVVGGAILIVAMPPIGLFLKDAPRGMYSSQHGTSGQPEGSTWREIRATPPYWLMVAAFVLAGGSINACIVHMAQIFSDRGASEASASVAVSVSGLALLVGRAGTGFFLDRYSGSGVALSVFSLASLGVALLLASGAGPLALMGTFLVGLGLGAEVDIMAYVLGRYFGLRSLGTAFGFAFGCFVLASGVGPLLMGAAFDRTGSYSLPLAVCLIFTILAAAQMSRLGPYRFIEPRQPETRAEVRLATET